MLWEVVAEKGQKYPHCPMKKRIIPAQLNQYWKNFHGCHLRFCSKLHQMCWKQFR